MMAKASARRASDDKLERLQALADTIAALQSDDDLDGDMSGDDAVDTLGSLIAWARTLSDAPVAQIKAIGPALRTFHDAYMQIQAKESPIQQAKHAADLARETELFGMKVVVRDDLPPNVMVMVDRQDDDGFVFITKEQVTPCKPCSGTGEIIEYPPDDDERMVACPACGGTGEAITL